MSGFDALGGMMSRMSRETNINGDGDLELGKDAFSKEGLEKTNEFFNENGINDDQLKDAGLEGADLMMLSEEAAGKDQKLSKDELNDLKGDDGKLDKDKVKKHLDTAKEKREKASDDRGVTPEK